MHAFGVWGDRPLALFQKVLQRALEDQSELSVSAQRRLSLKEDCALQRQPSSSKLGVSQVEESLLLLRGFSLAVFDAEGFRQKVAARVQLQKVSLKK